MPPRLRCTVGNEGIRSREQINLPEDNEIISHLQLLDEERKQCRCAVVFVGVAVRLRACISVYPSQTQTLVHGVTLKTICATYWEFFSSKPFFLILNLVSHATLYATGLLLVLTNVRLHS